MKAKYLMVAALATVMAACSNDENEVNDGPVAAQVSAGIDGVQTRAVNTTWEAGDQIGISTNTSGLTTVTNVLYTISNPTTGNFTSETPIYFKDQKDVQFAAYYPYDQSLEMKEGIIEKEIMADDQTETAQKKIDYMYAIGAVASKGTPEVKFIDKRTDVPAGADARFKHKMVKLTLKFKVGTADVSSIDAMTDFTISGLKMKGTFAAIDYGKAIITNDATAKDLKIVGLNIVANATDYTRSLILFPQEAATFDISLTFQGSTYKATVNVPAISETNAKHELESGKEYTYTVTINKTAINVSQAEIEGWGNGGSYDDNSATVQ